MKSFVAGIGMLAVICTGAAFAQLRPKPTSTASAMPPPALKLPHTLTVMSVKSDTYAIRLTTTPNPTTPMTCEIKPNGVYPENRGAVVCRFKFAGGTKVQLSAMKIPGDGSAATPVADWQWTNECAGTKGAVCTLTMDKDRVAEMTPGLL